MSANSENNGTMIAKSGQGPVQLSAWENERDGQKLGTTCTLTKSWYDRGEEKLKKNSVTLSLPELAAAIVAMQDLQQQLLAQSRMSD